MRTKISLVFIIMMSLISLQALFIEIGDGDVLQSYVPTYGFYDQGWSRTIYLQLELGDAQSFTSISYNVMTTPSNYTMENQKIYLRHTTESVLTEVSFNDPSTDDSYNEVFSGTVIWDGAGWATILFDNEFAYNGVDNLEIFYTNEDGTYSGGQPGFQATAAEGDRSVYKHQDGDFPTTNGTLFGYYPNIRLYYSEQNEPSMATLISPANNGTGLAFTQDLVWTMNANTDYVDVYFGANGASVSNSNGSVLVSSENSSENYTVNNLDPLTIYYWKVVAKNNTTDFETPSQTYIFITAAADGSVQIGDGSAVGQGLPCEPYYSYSISQTIYPQESINIENQRIEEIAYNFNGSNIFTEESVTIWMGHTDLDSFGTNESWVSIDDLVMVFEGVMTTDAINSWTSFQLLTPFNYNNTQNLVVGFEQNTSGFHAPSDDFFCTDVDANLSITKFSDTVDYDFIDPAPGVLRSYIPNTILTFGDSPTEPQLMVTPDEYEWDETIINTLGEEKTFVVRNSGLGTLTLNSIALDQNVDFILTDTNTYPVNISGNTIQFTVTFNPQSANDFAGNIVFTDSNNNVTNIPLTARGYDATISDFPYLQDFENDPVHSLPQDWASIIESPNQSVAVAITANNVYEGEQSVRFYNATDNDALLNLVTPPVQDLTGKRVRFMLRATHQGTGVTVGTYNGQLTTSTFTPIETILATTTYTQHSVSFDNYTGTDSMIGFRYVGTEATYVNSTMDNIYIEDIPTTPVLIVLPDTLYFGDVYLNGVETQTFDISNWGVQNLTGTVSCDDAYFSFDINEYNIAPSEAVPVEVTFSPQEEGEFVGSFTITSNDPNLPEIVVYGKAFVTPPLSDDTVFIGDGVLVNQHMPIEPYYGYSYSQVIYYSDEIGIEGSRIEKISWHYNGNTAWAGDEFKIYLGHTDLDEFANNVSWININQFMPVFDGTIETVAESGWIEFELEIPFIYDSTRNLVIAVEENTAGYHGNNDDFFCTASGATRGIVFYSDSINPDPVEPPVASFVMDSFANLKLEFGDIPDEPALVVLPGDITFDMTPANGQSVSRIINLRSIGLQNIVIDSAPVFTGANADQFAISVDNNNYPLTLPFNAITQVAVVFTPTSEGSKSAVLEIVDNATRTTHQVNLSGYGFADDGNDSANGATVIDVPTISGLFAIMPEGDIDWYKLPALGVLDTLFIYTEMAEGSNIDLKAMLYGPVTNPDEINISTPIANNSYGHGNNQPEITIEIPASGDYYLRIAENSRSVAGVRSPNTRKNPNGDTTRITRDVIGLYELTVDAILNYDYSAPLNLVAENADGYVSLSWTEPAYERYLVSYNVLRDGIEINNVPISENSYNDSEVVVGTEYTYTIVGVYEEPGGQSVPSNAVSITYFTTGEALFSDDFEAHNDFALNMANWIQYDEDGAGTYAINEVDFQNSGEPMSYIVFNPSMTTPPVENMNLESGEKILCSFASTEGTNDDWLITPRITIGTTTVISFSARSYTDQYELEKFRVLISQGGEEPSDFTLSLHQGTDYIVAPTEWTPYYFNVSELTGMTVRFAVQCITTDGFIFMMDNFRVDSTDDGVSNGNDVIPTLTQLGNNYPNPFNPETTISYSMKEAGDVRIDIYNLKGQRVKTLVNEFANEGAHQIVWNGQDDSNNSCASGLYFYKMTSGSYSKTNKMILMK